MDGIKGFIEKIQLDRDFRILLREAKTKEEKIKIIKQSGFDVSEKDIKRVVESISRIADENFQVIGNNGNMCEANCGSSGCSCKAPPDPCGVECNERASKNTRISIEIAEDKRNNWNIYQKKDNS